MVSEEDNEEDYKLMKERAGEFAKLCIKNEWKFTQEINDCDEGVAVYFDIKGRNNKIITVFYKDNGYVGIQLKDEDEDE